MTGQVIIRGLPDRLRNDGWWLTDAATQDHDGAGGPSGDLPLAVRFRGRPDALIAVVLLIVVADASFWNQDVGLSLAVFCLALSVAILTQKPGGTTRREWTLAFIFIAICNLPVIEHLSVISAGFSIGGVVVLAIWVAHGRLAGAWQGVVLISRASTIGATLLPRWAASELAENNSGTARKDLLRALLLPLLVGLIFLSLFAYANPILARALDQVTGFDWLSPDQIGRFLFWIAVACFIWPYLNVRALQRGADRSPTWVTRQTCPAPFERYINPRSVTLSLVLFNVMFLAQTLSDIGILTGGMALPDGITYAQYAHRGAYPLLVTALLAGLFAVGTHRMIADNSTLRWMVYAWLGQTLFLVLTAAFRLNLYVQAYSLTYLRITAFIWMGLVLIGLILIIVHIFQKRSLGWLVRSNTMIGIATLYLCCFANFTHIIVEYNLNAERPLDRLDVAYLCGLGEQAIPAMMEVGQVTDDTVCGRGGRPAIRYDPIETWQEWGFRRWRLGLYLAAHHDL